MDGVANARIGLGGVAPGLLSGAASRPCGPTEFAAHGGNSLIPAIASIHGRPERSGPSFQADSAAATGRAGGMVVGVVPGWLRGRASENPGKIDTQFGPCVY